MLAVHRNIYAAQAAQLGVKLQWKADALEAPVKPVGPEGPVAPVGPLGPVGPEGPAHKTAQQ